jgi:hypothetical protein
VNAQEWIKEFWQIGNWIVGFEVVQTFTLLYAVTKPEVRRFIEDPRLKRYLESWMIVVSAAFCSAVFWTSAQAIKLHKTLSMADGTSPLPQEGTLWVVVAGRIGCIALLTGLCVFAVCVHKPVRRSKGES